MKKLLATIILTLFTAACAQTGSMQGGMQEGMQCKCCAEMMKEGKECCCKGMMSGSDMKMGMDKKDGKMQCPMCAKMNEQSGTEKTAPKPAPASKTNPEEHEQHH